MSAYWGAIWLTICIVFGLGVWMCNVLVVDNAYPQILQAIHDNFSNSLMPNDNQAIMFLKMVDYAPLFIWFMGIIGFVAESVIWGRSEDEV